MSRLPGTELLCTLRRRLLTLRMLQSHAAPRFLGFLLLAMLSLGACGDDGGDSASDSGASDSGASDSETRDSGASDATVRDGGTPDSALDATVDASSDGEADAGSHTALLAEFGVDRTLTFAQFGRNGDGTLHIEVHGEPASFECPNEQTPAPAQTLVIGNVEATLGPRDQSSVLFDFERALTEEPLLRSMTGTLTLEAVEGDVQASVSFTFEGGVIAGSLLASHCDSLDD